MKCLLQPKLMFIIDDRVIPNSKTTSDHVDLYGAKKYKFHAINFSNFICKLIHKIRMIVHTSYSVVRRSIYSELGINIFYEVKANENISCMIIFVCK